MTDLLDIGLIYANQGPLSIFIHLIGSLLLAFIVRYYYLNFSSVVSSRQFLANAIPLLTGTTFLVIMVVKSSLALSLGLVGALSIVRFRAPIKEPEELAYIFLAVAIGLGAGAGKLELTAMIAVSILIADMIRNRWRRKKAADHNLLIELMDSADGQAESDKLLNVLEASGTPVEVTRLEVRPDRVAIVAHVPFSSLTEAKDLISNLRKVNPQVSCTIYDSRPVW